jgi:hypothetical protein
MEVINWESEAYKDFVRMFTESTESVKSLSETILKSRIGLLDVKQVAELTGYTEDTIRARKAEIGYSTMGKDLKFKPADVEAWINKYYRAPISKRR